MVVVYRLALLGAGCATHGAVHVAPDESKPHISWELRSGPDEGDEEFVCGSAQPGKPCVLAASPEKRRTLALVHLLVHAAAQPTSYLGFMRAPFLEDDTDRKRGEVSASVEPGRQPVGATVIGRVTSKPGAYTLTISVDAMQPGATNPMHIGEEVSVAVK